MYSSRWLVDRARYTAVDGHDTCLMVVSISCYSQRKKEE